MFVHSCCADHVLLSYEEIWAVRGADTSHCAEWVRNRSGMWAAPRALHVLSDIEGRSTYGVRDIRGIITASVRLIITKVYAASELAGNRAAITMILNHERNHLLRTELGMQYFFRKIGDDFERKHLEFLQEINAEFQRYAPTGTAVLKKAILEWDRADWPSLHRALQRVGVTLGLD